METVGSTLQGHIDDGAVRVAELGRSVRRRDADFRQGVDARIEGDAVVDGFIDVHAVK